METDSPLNTDPEKEGIVERGVAGAVPRNPAAFTGAFTGPTDHRDGTLPAVPAEQDGPHGETGVDDLKPIPNRNQYSADETAPSVEDPNALG